MSSRRPTDDCLALLEVLLWNHFLPTSINATIGTQAGFLQTTPIHDRQIICTYLDWLATRGYLAGQQLSASGHRDLACHSTDWSAHRQVTLTESGARFAVEAMRQQGRWEQMASLLAIRNPTTRMTDHKHSDHLLSERATDSPVIPPRSLQPYWDSHHRELWLGYGLVKKIRTSATNQERLLAAFQEEDWPACVYDPLPPVGDVDPKQRLLDTVRRLNGHQLSLRIHFLITHHGEQVAWQHQATN
ncbi:MAG: hypothetical protein VX346_00745 [Planctomycetota bacterium]|nr:hypothetical protein [Planctomycetota bacterium]